MARPRGWLVVDCLTAMERVEHTLDHQIVPAKPRVRPGDVVGVDDLGIHHGDAQAVRQRRFPASAAAVDRNNPRATDGPTAGADERSD